MKYSILLCSDGPDPLGFKLLYISPPQQGHQQKSMHRLHGLSVLHLGKVEIIRVSHRNGQVVSPSLRINFLPFGLNILNHMLLFPTNDYNDVVLLLIRGSCSLLFI